MLTSPELDLVIINFNPLGRINKTYQNRSANKTGIIRTQGI